MQSPINSIIRQSIRKQNEPIRVLTACTHEAFETGLAKTNSEFYAIPGKDIKPWNSNYRPIPSNYHVCNSLPDIEFDVVLSQQKFGQFQLLHPISRQLHLPLISLEHTLPHIGWPNGTVGELKEMKGEINVFISKYSREKWGWTEQEARVIHHGINTDLFKPGNIQRRNVVLTVANDYLNRDWCLNFQLYQKLVKGLPAHPVGDTQGFSLPAKSVQELVSFYQSSRIFLNTSSISPIPTALLEAMSSGCACVSSSTCMIPTIIKHGVNGFISNNEKELRGYLELLLKDEKLAKELGENARRTIIENFSEQKFVDNWNKVFIEASNLVYKGE